MSDIDDEPATHQLDMQDGSENEAGPSTAVVRKASKKPVKKKSTKPSPGIVYISRLPPGMTPQKVRHLMARWGEVGKVYAQRRDAALIGPAPTGYDPNHAANEKKRKKHAAANFSEAWVEFMDKSVAKTVACLLNAEVIGGKKGDRWRDDIWTMKYLSGFRWEMLGAQVAYEKQAHQSRLNAEISRSRTEQSEYLKNVELARVLAKRKQKRQEKEGQVVPGTPGAATQAAKEDSLQRKRPLDISGETGDDERKRFRQREAVARGKGSSGAGIDQVLGAVFG